MPPALWVPSGGALRRRPEKNAGADAGHYPAPMKIIDVIEAGFQHGPAAGLEAERCGLAELMGTDACRNLLRLFFLRQGAKREIAASVPAKPLELNYAAVIGGGTMGAGIAHGMVKAGIQVRLVEVDAKAAAAGLGRIRHMLDDDVAAGRMTALDARHALNRVAPTIEWTGLGLAGIVIEAVIEKMDLKREVFSKLDRLTRPQAVLASNTSSLSITEMARSVSRPGRVVGLHFFNPVPKMPLVEVVRTADSDAEALATAAALAGRMGKTPVLVGDAPGFLVNRVLIPYLAEALALAAEGTPIPRIDEAMKNWGMPMGPFELLDEIGLDVSVHVLRSLNEQTGSRMTIPAGFERALERGWLGKKTGTGFYRYPGKGKKAAPELNQELSTALAGGTHASAPTSDAAVIQWRLVLPMTNEAARVLEEGVTDSTDAIDLATVLGLGLAPFRGGLARFADSVGADQLVVRLSGLAARLGPRFEPAPLLRRFAESHRMLAEFRELSASRPNVMFRLQSPLPRYHRGHGETEARSPVEGGNLGAMSHACVGMGVGRVMQVQSVETCPRKRGTWHPKDSHAYRGPVRIVRMGGPRSRPCKRDFQEARCPRSNEKTRNRWNAPRTFWKARRRRWGSSSRFSSAGSSWRT